MLVQYCLVDHSLKMRRGKTCAQVGHAFTQQAVDVLMLGPSNFYKSVFIRWYKTGQTKIVLKCKTEDLDRAMVEISGSQEVRDLGKTEVDPDTRTVVILPIMPKDDVPEWIRELPLL